CCGRYFAHLGHHIAIHDLTPAEYKAIFGLNATTGLIGPDLREKRSRAGKQRAAGGQLVPAMLHALRFNSSEQRSAASKGRKIRLEQRLKPPQPGSSARGAQTLKRKYAEGVYTPIGWPKDPRQ